MNKRDNQKMNMYNAVLNICRQQQTAWETIPGFVSAVADLEARLLELNHTYALRLSATTGVSVAKNELKTELAEHLYILGKALSLKGLEINDRELDLRNRISLSRLKTLPANSLLHLIEAMQTDIEIHGESLAAYGITASFIDETESLMAQTSNVLFKPRMAIITRKGLTKAVKNQTCYIDKLIKSQLDTFILSFKTALPAFYNAYFNARIIIDYGHGSGGGVNERDDGALAV